MRASTTLVIAVTSLVLGLCAHAPAQIINDGGQATITYQQQDGSELITVTVGQVALKPITINDQKWAVVEVAGGHNLMLRGEPALPFVASELLLERTDRISLELVGAVEQELDLASHGYAGVAPSRGHFDRDQDPDSIPYVFNEKLYASPHLYPDDRVWVDDPFIAGPLRGQGFRIPVARWQARDNLLVLVRQATFRISRATDTGNPRLGRQPALTALFDQMARLRMVNYQAARPGYTPFVEAGRLLILAHDPFLANVQPLADWEMLVGYPTMLEPLSSVPHAGASPTAAEIKTYIQGLYDDPEGLTWVILVGDYQHIPNLAGVNEGAPCDPCYTKLEGSDNRPDAAISRISALNTDQVDVQVAKILGYEQYPDSGSAAAWYQKAFGIASHEGSPADWERMNLLRDDLLAYTYTEFTELYISPTAQDVADAVNDGRSLGLYIGHGAETYWVTSGFSVSDVNTKLSNGSMLPVIWDVACVNGAFHALDTCFAEAWLRKSGGGAVSFEAATTNESWVPPCDAQRGIIDALRLEEAFTTGGQHVNGKGYCMDINGDSDSSEGNRFMEQSTLFGSCVTWPRTLEAIAPDEPTDFQVSGGQATLTVTVGGSPYTKPNGAIVSFYNQTADGIDVVGSGHIDGTGVVTVPVTADPTYCHIHGYNLIATTYELAAQPDGRVTLDAAVYSCTSEVAIRVADSNVGAGTVDVTLGAGGEDTLVTLTEQSTGSGFFTGTYVLGSAYTVADGETLVATYHDADIGDGNPADKTANALIDCAGPVMQDVATDPAEKSAVITFTTDEPGTTRVIWGDSLPPALIAESTELVTEHSITLSNLLPCTRYYFYLESEDALGNQSTAGYGSYYSFVTDGWDVILETNLDTDPGWTIYNGGNANGWAFGTPSGQGGQYGNPDPTSGYTGDNVYGVNLDGDYDNNLTYNQLRLLTPSLDLSEASTVILRFWRWLGIEGKPNDLARVNVSINGEPWIIIWQSSANYGGTWVEESFDLTDLAAGQSDVRIRWTLGSTDSSMQFAGWNIDDIVIEGTVPCALSQPIFIDGFESGDTSAWSEVVIE
jgi:gingipain R